MARSLTPAERISYDHVSLETRSRARVKALRWLPGTFHGITLGRYVFLTLAQPDDGTSTLIAHELVHVEQYRNRGVVGFVRWYVADFAGCLKLQRSWMPAYRDIEAEVEARLLTAEWARRRAGG